MPGLGLVSPLPIVPGEKVRPPLVGAPLRGTQSLVGVMGFVWRHPSLTLLELLWRWLAAVPLLWLAWRHMAPVVAGVPLNVAALGSMTFFEPVRSAALLAGQARLYLEPTRRLALWWVPLGLLLWTASAAVGKSLSLRRVADVNRSAAGPGLESKRHATSFGAQILPMGLSSGLRAVLFLTLLLIWWRALLAAVRLTVLSPAQRGGEPNLVLCTAVLVGLTLAAFLGWSLVIWVLDLQPLTRFTPERLHTSAQHAKLRSKLVETNLVMGIVRVALLVLAMTFSASPLPFQSRETQTFIDVWWMGVGLFYLVSSDFFHVVRRVTYLRLLESVASDTNGAAAAAS